MPVVCHVFFLSQAFFSHVRFFSFLDTVLIFVAGGQPWVTITRMRAPRDTRPVRIPLDSLARVYELRDEIEHIAGVRPQMKSLITRIIDDGVETLRKRPALAVDTAPRKGDR